jgi:hypothetical protein
MEAKGHAVDNARAAVDRLEKPPAISSDADARPRAGRPDANAPADEGEKLGGKSAEAARFILKAIDRELANA